MLDKFFQNDKFFKKKISTFHFKFQANRGILIYWFLYCVFFVTLTIESKIRGFKLSEMSWLQSYFTELCGFSQEKLTKTQSQKCFVQKEFLLHKFFLSFLDENVLKEFSNLKEDKQTKFPFELFFEFNETLNS